MTKKDVKVKSVAKRGYFDDRFKKILDLHNKKLASQKGGNE